VPLNWKQQRPTLLVAILLLAQGSVFYTLSHGDAVPLAHPLSEFPTRVQDWNVIEDGVIDQETRDLLRADDYLTRVYANRATGEEANLYVAFFKTQQTGQTPHSPKNCLPGNGWVPSASGRLNVSIPGRDVPVRVNEYLVAKGATKALVLYWYQSHGRVVASEYAAKAWVVVDSLRYHRSDTALIRVVVGVPDGNEEAAARTATHFVQAFFQPLAQTLPN
jgi:EpsI family protein